MSHQCHVRATLDGAVSRYLSGNFNKARVSMEGGEEEGGEEEVKVV